MPIRLRWPRALLVLVLIGTAACNGLPIPILTFATPGPSPTPRPAGPSPTPPPMALVSFLVHVPANTPPGSAPAVKVIDDVGGTSLIVPLISAGNNAWSGGTQAAVGSVLRYRFIRSLPSYVEEVTPDRQSVPYRLLAVTDTSQNAEDTVAAWDDTPFAGDLGSVSGVVRNSNTGQGVMGAIVSAGGRTSLTAWDGTFIFFDLPAGAQRVTILAPDGSLRPAQGIAMLNPGQAASLEIITRDPNAVHVTFVVRGPAGVDGSAPLRMAGNVLQLGDTFVLQANDSAIAAARQPVMVPVSDGRWMATLLLYEGTVLRYKYTLGDGVWNGELDSAGARRLRTLVVPGVDASVEDSIDAWHAGTSATVTFDLNAPGNTPPDDEIVIQFRPGAWHPPVPMWRVGVNTWRFVLYNPTDQSGSVFYRYCRNYACGTADDTATAGFNATGRFFTPTLLPQDLRDSVGAWQWLADAPPASGLLPQVNVHPGFAAGIDFADGRGLNDHPELVETLRRLPAAGASWITLMPAGQPLRINPAPAYADDLAAAPFFSDYKTLVDQAHNAGMRIALHPVTCHYTPYGACPYWQGAAYGPEFWNAWFAAYEKYIVTQAELAARSSADMLVIGDFKLRPSFPGEPEAPPDAEARWRNLIQVIRVHYSGRLGFELLMGDAVWPSPPAFLDSVDVIRLFWWSALSAGPAPVVSDLANSAGGLMDAHLLPLRQRFNKTIHISAAYYAADGASTQCLKRDDGQCHSFEDFNPGGQDVLRYPLDLQEQADIYQGLLLAVNARDWIGGFSTYGYNPLTALRDKSLSVRGKPAEAVISAWYPRLQGR